MDPGSAAAGSNYGYQSISYSVYRYSYSGGTYTLDAGFRTIIADNSSESMTIDQDSTGAIWAT